MALTIIVNGQPHRCGSTTPTVADLVAELGLVGKRVAVERNAQIVPRGAYAQTPVGADDRFEIVVAVGGG
ncbi:MAG: sulfur carrier protein ThiS [Betaproteobacteria bacterium]|jgi:sulfur carrier protein|nr:sulfur carrier protein ThiS [Betaproteobacteria bacterium]